MAWKADLAYQEMTAVLSHCCTNSVAGFQKVWAQSKEETLGSDRETPSVLTKQGVSAAQSSECCDQVSWQCLQSCGEGGAGQEFFNVPIYM